MAVLLVVSIWDKDLYKQLEEFDINDSNYYNVQQQLKTIETEISKVQSDLTKLKKIHLFNDKNRGRVLRFNNSLKSFFNKE